MTKLHMIQAGDSDSDAVTIYFPPPCYPRCAYFDQLNGAHPE